jgi:hypothetical protein
MTQEASPDPAVMSAAIALIRQYGEDAEVIAVMRAAELAAMGDAAALAHWDAVILCISGLQGTGGSDGGDFTPPRH